MICVYLQRLILTQSSMLCMTIYDGRGLSVQDLHAKHHWDEVFSM